MAFEIKTRVISDFVILDMSGRLCVMEYALRETVNKLLDEGRRQFVLNLTEVSYVDSFGLGQLVGVWTSIQRKGGRVTLTHPTQRVRKLLEITKLDTVFQIFEDQVTAIFEDQVTAIDDACRDRCGHRP